MLLREYLEVKTVGDVGIEIECEGQNLPIALPASSGWKIVTDGSLRGGYEYIFKGARPVSKVRGMIDVLNDAFKEHDTKLDFSFRTSVHVHVNCLDLEYVQIMNALYAYLLFEPALLHFSGETRKCNRFCLGVSDAEGFLNTVSFLFAYIGSDEGFNALGNIREDNVKYSAINVASLRKHGTIEIRSMRGTNDPKVLNPWVETLVEIRNWASQFSSPKDVYDYVRQKGILFCFKEIAGRNYAAFSYSQIEEELAMSMSLTIDIPHTESRVPAKAKKKVLNNRLRIADIVDEARIGNFFVGPNPFAAAPPPPQLRPDMLIMDPVGYDGDDFEDMPVQPR